MELDNIDRAILRILQRDGKIGLQDIAEQVGLSSSPCWRRIRRMEDAGLIDRYAAILNPKAVDLNTQAYMYVSLLDHREETVATFNHFVQTEEHVIECCSISGSNDYLLKVVARDPEALEEFIMQRVLRLGIVRASNTNFVLRRTKSSMALPV